MKPYSPYFWLLALVIYSFGNIHLSAAQTTHKPSPLGVMWLTKTTTAYTEGPTVGRSYRLLRNQSYPVINLTIDELGQAWRKLKLPQYSQTKSGIGWSPLEAHQLSEGYETVIIYTQLPEDVRSPLNSLHLLADDVFLLNAEQTVRGFPLIVWNKARYRTKVVAEAWVLAEHGIFRVGITEKHMLEAYEDMVSRQISLLKRTRLLNGVVLPGDSQQEVRWALGEPLLVRSKRQGYLRKQVIWEYQGFAVSFQSDGLIEVTIP